MLALRVWIVFVFLRCLYASSPKESEQSLESNTECDIISYYYNRTTQEFRVCDESKDECPMPPTSKNADDKKMACLLIIRYKIFWNTDTTNTCPSQTDVIPLFEMSYGYMNIEPENNTIPECTHTKRASICYCQDKHCNTMDKLAGLLASKSRPAISEGKTRFAEVLEDLSLDIKYLSVSKDIRSLKGSDLVDRLACLQRQLRDLQLLFHTTVSTQIAGDSTSTEGSTEQPEQSFASEEGGETTTTPTEAANKAASHSTGKASPVEPTESATMDSSTTLTTKAQISLETTTLVYTTGKTATEQHPSSKSSSSTGWHIGSAVVCGLLVVVILILAILLLKKCGEGKKGKAKEQQNMAQPKEIKIENLPIRNVNEVLAVAPVQSVPTSKPVPQQVHSTAGPEEDTLMTGQEDSLGDAGIDSTTSGYSDSTGTDGSSQATVTVRGFSQK